MVKDRQPTPTLGAIQVGGRLFVNWAKERKTSQQQCAHRRAGGDVERPPGLHLPGTLEVSGSKCCCSI